jgi:RimJ/RimL family protein N-acetyltransferase
MKFQKIYLFFSFILGFILTVTPVAQGMELLAIASIKKSYKVKFLRSLPLNCFEKTYLGFKPLITILREYNEQKDYEHIRNVFKDDVEWSYLTGGSPRTPEFEKVIESMIKSRIFPDFSNKPFLKISVAYHLNRFAGFIAFCKADSDNGHVVFLHVNKKLRGLNLGEKLLKSAMNSLFKDNVKRIWLTTDTQNYRSLSLYRKAGFNIFDMRDGSNYLQITKAKLDEMMRIKKYL